MNSKKPVIFLPFFSTRLSPDGKYQSVLFYANKKALFHQESFPTREAAIKFSKQMAQEKKRLYISEDSGFVTIATIGIGPNNFVAIYVGINSNTVGKGIVGKIENAQADAVKYARENNLTFMDYYGYDLTPK